MSVFKAIFSIYIGIYLVLPSCFCQVVSAFGGEALPHALIEEGEKKNKPDALSVCASSDLLPPICHCDEGGEKIAEAGNSNEHQYLPFPCSRLIPRIHRAPGDSESQFLAPARAPPGQPRWSLLPFSGVYLI
ncbi:MAG: hypothetical protein P1U85_04360 [Verrucomicrobiales bacterium]|nr:hypothetical protein [Verrucomicrobiales bacterium]